MNRLCAIWNVSGRSRAFLSAKSLTMVPSCSAVRHPFLDRNTVTPTWSMETKATVPPYLGGKLIASLTPMGVLGVNGTRIGCGRGSRMSKRKMVGVAVRILLWNVLVVNHKDGASGRANSSIPMDRCVRRLRRIPDVDVPPGLVYLQDGRGIAVPTTYELPSSSVVTPWKPPHFPCVTSVRLALHKSFLRCGSNFNSQ